MKGKARCPKCRGQQHRKVSLWKQQPQGDQLVNVYNVTCKCGFVFSHRVTVPALKVASEPDLFSPPPLPVKTPMIRSKDYETSKDAADRVKPTLSKLQLAVLQAIRNAGDVGLTDWEIETLPEFQQYSYSTVRKRRTELTQHGYLEECGTKISGYSGSSNMTLWRIRQQ